MLDGTLLGEADFVVANKRIHPRNAYKMREGCQFRIKDRFFVLCEGMGGVCVVFFKFPRYFISVVVWYLMR